MVANEWRTVLCLSRITGHPRLTSAAELADRSMHLSGTEISPCPPNKRARNHLSRFSQNVKPGSCQSQCSNRSRASGSFPNSPDTASPRTSLPAALTRLSSVATDSGSRRWAHKPPRRGPRGIARLLTRMPRLRRNSETHKIVRYEHGSVAKRDLWESFDSGEIRRIEAEPVGPLANRERSLLVDEETERRSVIGSLRRIRVSRSRLGCTSSRRRPQSGIRAGKSGRGSPGPHCFLFRSPGSNVLLQHEATTLPAANRAAHTPRFSRTERSGIDMNILSGISVCDNSDSIVSRILPIRLGRVVKLT